MKVTHTYIWSLGFLQPFKDVGQRENFMQRNFSKEGTVFVYQVFSTGNEASEPPEYGWDYSTGDKE